MFHSQGLYSGGIADSIFYLKEFPTKSFTPSFPHLTKNSNRTRYFYTTGHLGSQPTPPTIRHDVFTIRRQLCDWTQLTAVQDLFSVIPQLVSLPIIAHSFTFDGRFDKKYHGPSPFLMRTDFFFIRYLKVYITLSDPSNQLRFFGIFF